LRARAIRLVRMLTGVDGPAAASALQAAQGRVMGAVERLKVSRLRKKGGRPRSRK